MTVSRVINGGLNVRQDTRDAVNAAIDALSYSPNAAARMLATAATWSTIALCTTPRRGNPPEAAAATSRSATPGYAMSPSTMVIFVPAAVSSPSAWEVAADGADRPLRTR